MNDEPAAEAARRLVLAHIERGFIAEPRSREAELQAVRITAPDGAPAGWFVALVIGDRLIGFAQLDEALRFSRYASFAGHEPAAGDWLDADTMRARVAAQADPGLELGRPFLSYDGHPDRVAWIVPATAPDGRERRFLVTGREVFERRA